MHKTKMYAKALLEVLEGKSEKEQKLVAQRLKQLLKKRGDLRLLSAIVKEVESLQQGNPAQVVTAFKLSEQARSMVKKYLEQKGFSMQEKVDAHVLGGIAVYLGKEYMIDGTVRGKLQKLWQKISY
ncbi:F0F1 ATP synthase subunit delta [Patescibacteria group bacterium]|nr:F0F1 ATP synthase subunit delta [Patescibacteria group bacterium]